MSNKRRRGGNRLVHQVEQALKEINYIGQSKLEAKDKGNSGIHSTTQIKHALSATQNFAKWLKEEHGMSDLYQLKKAHFEEYIEHMRGTGVTNGHLINIETNLRLLNKGMAKVSEGKGHRVRDWVPKERMVASRERDKPKNRALADSEVQRVRSEVSSAVGVGVDLAMAFGVRLREAANSNRAHIEERNGTFYWVAVADRNAPNRSVGVTKAGRPREARIRPGYEAVVREMIKGKAPDEKLCSVKYNTLKSAYTRCGVGGNHAFRHTYARDMVMLEFEKRGIVSEGRQMLQKMLENRYKGFRKDHLLEREERPLYKQVNEVVDLVHGYLGHGQGRIDLCEVYMSF